MLGLLVVEGGGGGGQASRELLGLGCCLSGPGERPQRGDELGRKSSGFRALEAALR